jgi:hypothetical protein
MVFPRRMKGSALAPLSTQAQRAKAAAAIDNDQTEEKELAHAVPDRPLYRSGQEEEQEEEEDQCPTM